jgi:hypothetical protein
MLFDPPSDRCSDCGWGERSPGYPSIFREQSVSDPFFDMGLNLPGLNQALVDIRNRFCGSLNVRNLVYHGEKRCFESVSVLFGIAQLSRNSAKATRIQRRREAQNSAFAIAAQRKESSSHEHGEEELIVLGTSDNEVEVLL